MPSAFPLWEDSGSLMIELMNIELDISHKRSHGGFRESSTSLSENAQEVSAMPAYHLIVAQYDLLRGHKYRNEHWSLVALKNKDEAHIFQLFGNADTFVYLPSRHPSFQTSENLCGGCVVGSVEEGKVEWVLEKLREVEVIRYKPGEFDCQTWVIQALRLLKDAEEEGVNILEVSDRKIREELMEERERWELGEDTLEERLFL